MLTKVELKSRADKADQKAKEAEGPSYHLSTWKVLLAHFKSATENDLWKLLEYELKHKRRRSFVWRIYGRACDMRNDKEVKELHLALSK